MSSFSQWMVRGLAVWAILAGDAARADLRFHQPIVDVDVVRCGRPLSHDFTFINHGPEAVEILDLRGSCGCLAPRLDQKVFEPGAEGSIHVEVNTLGQASGPHTWTVRVPYRQGGETREAAVQIVARLISEVSVQPATLTLFADQAAGHEITVTDLRPKPLAIAFVQSSSPHIRARLGEQQRDAAGHWVRKVRFELADDYPVGRHDEVLSLITDDPVYPELKVHLTVVKQPRQQVRALPAEVTLAARGGQPAPAQLVRLQDRAGRPVVIDRLVPEHPALRCTWAPGPNEMATIRIQVDAAAMPLTNLTSRVQVELSQPALQTLVIPVQFLRE
jgi:hypothetical protein